MLFQCLLLIKMVNIYFFTTSALRDVQKLGAEVAQ